MLTYIAKAFNYFFPKHSDDDSDDDKEDFLAAQLVELEATCLDSDQEAADLPNSPRQNIPRDAECFQRTGVITYMAEDYVLIDGMLFFDTTSCSVSLNLNDRVLYLCYKNDKDSVIVVRILENQGIVWGDIEEEASESNYKVIEHTLVGEVLGRQERLVFIKDNDLKFNLDDVEATFVPVEGDWLEMKCTVQYDEEKPADISADQVLKVISFKPLRRKIKSGVVTDWFGESGTCDKVIYFDKQSLQTTFEPSLGTRVMVEAIESVQGTCSWRAIKVIFIEASGRDQAIKESSDPRDATLELEQDKKIELTYPIKFDSVDFRSTQKLTISITNKSNDIHFINKWMILSKKRDSQVDIKPFLNRPVKLQPQQTLFFHITCYPKFLGNAKECLIFMFRGFQLKRFIEMTVVDNQSIHAQKTGDGQVELRSETERITKLLNIRKGNQSFISGARPVKPPAFVPVKIGQFNIPDKVWSAVLGDSEQTICSSEYDTILNRIESSLRCLSEELCLDNYAERWHTLLYMEEIQCNINIRAYDMSKAFLIRCQEYLAIEIPGLSERRPSLIKGDRVIVKDIWDPNAQNYEGFIHNIKGDLVLMKFNSHFHEIYMGSDVSLEFHFNRSGFRRTHQAITLTRANLGPDILFPKRVLSRDPQVPFDQMKEIKWYNSKVNDDQKAAVKNILAGQSRPLPYCIFGPPGTGKTVTVIETILQILTHMPDSRILVATPSNSAANVITERLVENRSSFSDSVIRLIANYLIDSDNIPENIKPFCATLDIAREETSKSRYTTENGIHMNCQKSMIGRHRVTIGTCVCLGSLAQLGFPKGHFTHIIVDEAGQATEPEIMIPLTFIDRDNGQIILAGDPMQLGPVVMSRYCKDFGFDESYLERILDTFPYQKDFNAFRDGFNKKLVTKLNKNYRSLEEVLRLPSQMFYDGSLVPKFDRNDENVKKYMAVVSEVLETSDESSGGIYVYGIRGCNLRAEESPSWYNPQEASMVALTTCKLLKKNVPPEDIGIITPYIAQVKYLRLLFESMGLPQPKIGSVEEFQGQERPIILISTVRSVESLLAQDQKYTIGFVGNPKRFNVALTRAQVAVITFCNPHVLSMDPLWVKVIRNSVSENKYLGCDLPTSCES